MSRIFISHSSANNAHALAVASWLEENGWSDYFLDVEPSRGLAPGERWQEALRKAANRCEAVLFLISPAWLASKWCLAEFLLAEQLGKAIFGVMIESTQLDKLPAEMSSEWQLCDLATGEARRSFRVSHDPFVVATEISLAEAGFARLKIGLERAGLDPSSFPWPPPGEPGRAPYRGLAALEPQDAAVFFGRDADIVRGLDALRTMRESGVEQLFVILGASGAGKSSFLRAGLWPRLKRNDRQFLPLPVIRPGRAVIEGDTGLLASLEVAFRDCSLPRSRAAIRAGLKDGGLSRLLDQFQEGTPVCMPSEAAAPTIVIPIDQGEELSAAEGREEAELFLEMLADALGSNSERYTQRNPAIGIVAIRSDSYERFQTDRHLADIRPKLLSLPPIPRTGYKDVIEAPAARATDAGSRLIFQPTLTQKLLEDAEGADALPLLGFTLQRLFLEHRGEETLSVESYEALGGARGAIEAAVSAAFADPQSSPIVPAEKAEREKLLRKAFVPWLALVDPQTEERKRRVARWDELPAETHPLIERLIGARLLTRDRRRIEGGGPETTVVEAAHEALLRRWPLLAGWLDQDAHELKTAEAVRRAAIEWRKNNSGEAWLAHTGERLTAAEQICQRPDFQCLLGSDGGVYLRACRRRDDAVRRESEAQLKRTARAQRVAWAAIGATVILMTLAGNAIFRQAEKVGRQTSLVLSADAQRANDAGLHDRALRYAVAASREDLLSQPVPQAEAQLARAAQASMLVSELRGHAGNVRRAVFSPDGTRVVTASEDRSARVWDVGSGKTIAILTGHKGWVHTAAFSPDGNLVVTASEDKTAMIWDAATGRRTACLEGHTGQVFDAAFAPDGKQVVTASEDKMTIVWDADSGRPTLRLGGHRDSVAHAGTSMDGTWVFAGSTDGTVRVWEAASGRLVSTLEGPRGYLWSAGFSPDCKWVVTASDDTARVWEATSGGLIAILDGHEATVTSAAFSPDSMRVVTASRDRSARIWDVSTGKAVARLDHESVATSARFSPDGRLVMTVSGDEAVVWDAGSGNRVARLAGHGGYVFSAAFSPDGAQVVTASEDATARVWAVTSGRTVTPLEGFRGRVTMPAAFSPGGKELATVDFKKVQLWETGTGVSIVDLEGHQGQVFAAAFSPDGKQVATASLDGTVAVWDARTGKPVARFVHGDGDVRSAAFSPDGLRIVTGSESGGRVWDVGTGKLIAHFAGRNHRVESAAFSPDGARVASAGQKAFVWNAGTGEELARIDGHLSWINSVAFSPDGNRVVTASNDGSAAVWGADSKRPVVRFEGHEERADSAAFSRDGQRVVTVSPAAVRVWDVASGNQVALLQGFSGAVRSAVLSPDETQVIAATADGAIERRDVRWTTRLHGIELVNAVCREKLASASSLTPQDVRSAPLLAERAGEDVCAPRSWLALAWDAVLALRPWKTGPGEAP